MLAATLPGRGGDAVALGSPLQIRPRIRRRGALREQLVGAGVRLAFSLAEVDERVLDDAHRFFAASFGEPRPRCLQLDPPAHHRIAGVGQLDRSVDVSRCRIDPPDRPRRGGPSEQKQRLSFRGRSQAGEQAEQDLWFDRVGDRLAEPHDHVHRPLVVAGLECQRDRLDGATALEQLLAQLLRDPGLDGSQPERRRHRQLQTAGDLPAQRDAGEQRLLHETATAQPLEQRWLQPRCAGEQADDRLLARREQMEGVGSHGTDDARRQRDEVGAGQPPSLIERHRDDAHAAIGGLDHALRRRDRLVPELGLDLLGRQRHRVGVDHEAVDELGDLVDGGRQDSPGDVEAGGGRRSLHALDESFDLVLVEEVGVVDDKRPVVERVERRRGELAP